jgi:hypothetical protein
MLVTLILGIAAGAGAPYAEPYVKNAIQGILLSDAPLTELELRSFSLAACLVAAAILAWILGNGSALALAIGAALGVFGPRLIDKIQARRVPDYDE